MKYKQVIKQLIKAGIIGGLVIVICTVFYFIVTSYVQDAENVIQQKNGELQMMRGNYAVIDSRVNDVNQASKFYVEFQQSDSSKIESFRRENANRVIAQIGERLGIDQLFLAMGQFKEVGGVFKKETVGLYSAEITVQYLAYTDDAVFNLIKSIEEMFPGSVRIEKFTMKREQFRDQLLVEISDESKKGIVGGDITFSWSGIQENERKTIPASANGEPVEPTPPQPATIGGNNAPPM